MRGEGEEKVKDEARFQAWRTVMHLQKWGTGGFRLEGRDRIPFR